MHKHTIQQNIWLKFAEEIETAEMKKSDDRDPAALEIWWSGVFGFTASQ